MKRKISLVLVIMMLISSMLFTVSAQEVDRVHLSQDMNFMNNVIKFVLNEYQYEVQYNDMMKGLYTGFYDTLETTGIDVGKKIIPIRSFPPGSDKTNMFEEDMIILENMIYSTLNKSKTAIDYEQLMNNLYDGFFGVLDEYSVYYTPEEYKNLIGYWEGEFVGIGVQITERNNQIVVVTPLANAPALEAGIQPGDIIRYVDGVDITGFTASKATAMIKGEEGTNVSIGILRNGVNLTFNITRSTVVTSTVEGSVLDDGIGYLKVTEFNENTVSLVEKELSKFDKKNITKVLLDLRNNGGGILGAAVDMLNLFVTEGPLVYVDYASGKEDVFKSTLKEQKYELAILINGGSASATEIFVGAVKDKKEGTIIGTQSFGKGIVQTIYPLLDGAGIKFTTAEYLSANKNKVHGIGITPDMIIENPLGEPKVDLSEYSPFTNKHKPSLGDVGADVFTAEKILQTLGYEVDEPDDILDEVTFKQIQKFQDDNFLFAYGTLDLTTQTFLRSALETHAAPDVEDLQFKTAIEVLKGK